MTEPRCAKCHGKGKYAGIGYMVLCDNRGRNGLTCDEDPAYYPGAKALAATRPEPGRRKIVPYDRNGPGVGDILWDEDWGCAGKVVSTGAHFVDPTKGGAIVLHYELEALGALPPPRCTSSA